MVEEDDDENFLALSQEFSAFSACNSNISGELQRLPSVSGLNSKTKLQQCEGFLEREYISTEIIENLSPKYMLLTVKNCVEGLELTSFVVKRSAAAKLRLRTKNRSDNRVLVDESGAVPALIPLLQYSDAAARFRIKNQFTSSKYPKSSLKEIKKDMSTTEGTGKTNDGGAPEKTVETIYHRTSAGQPPVTEKVEVVHVTEESESTPGIFGTAAAALKDVVHPPPAKDDDPVPK